MAPSMVFPVPDPLLPRVTLTPEQHQELREFAITVARTALREAKTCGKRMADSVLLDRAWKEVSSTPTSKLLIKVEKAKPVSSSAVNNQEEGKHHSTSAIRGHSFLGISEWASSFEEIVNGFYSESTEEYRSMVGTIYGKYCLDACVVQTLERATLKDPFWYLGLKWVALKSPMNKFISSREFVFLEHSGSYTNTDGQQMLYRIFQSIDIRGYGGQASYFGLIRGHFEASFVYWQDEENYGSVMGNQKINDKGVMQMAAKGRFDLRGSLPKWLVYKTLKRFFQNFPHAQSKQDNEQLESEVFGTSPSLHVDKGPLEMAAYWVRDEDRPACAVCQRKFHFMRRLRHHCRACGEVVCRECTSYHRLYLRQRSHTLRSLYNSYPSSSSSAESTNSSNPRLTTHSDRTENIATLNGGTTEESNGPTVIGLARVCHRCIDLRPFPRRNSTVGTYELEEPQEPVLPTPRANSLYTDDENDLADVPTLAADPDADSTDDEVAYKRIIEEVKRRRRQHPQPITTRIFVPPKREDAPEVEDWMDDIVFRPRHTNEGFI